MAGNYGLDSGGNVVIQQPANTGNGPATRLTGGGGSSFSGFAQTSQAPGGNFGALADTSLKTVEALNKLADGVLTPMIEAEQKRQYFEGMAQVAQGKTLLDIQKEQPWYTKIFGPSASVQGAQAMTMMGALNQAETDFYTALPDLAKSPPDAARAWMVKQATELSQTGDATMDAMVQAKLAEQMPRYMQQHMKRHLEYVQDKNNTAFGNNLVTAGKALQEKSKQTGFFSSDDLALEKSRALEAFQPMPGMTDDAWQSNVVKGLRAGMMDGNFAIYEAFKESELYQRLPADKKDHLEHQILPYATSWVERHNPNYMDRWMDRTVLSAALHQGQGPQTPEALDQWIDGQNAKFAIQSGSSKPLYDNQERAKQHAAWIKGQEYKQKQIARAEQLRLGQALEAASIVEQMSATGRTLNSGIPDPLLSQVAPENAQKELTNRWDDVIKSGDPVKLENHIKQLAVASTYGAKMVDKRLSMQMTSAANNFLTQGMSVSDNMKQNLHFMGLMSAAPNGIAGLSEYIGAENAAKMTAFVSSGVDLTDPSAVDVIRTSIRRGWNAPVTQADRKAVDNFLADNDTLMQKYLPLAGEGALTPYELNDASKTRLRELIVPTATMMQKGLGISTEQAISLAFSYRFGNPSKVDYVDGALSEPAPASNWKSMYAEVSELRNVRNQGSEDYQQALKNVINNAMGAAIGKVPVEQPPRSNAAKFGDKVRDFSKDVMLKPLGIGAAFEWTEGVTKGLVKPGEFNPNDYETAALTQIASGVLHVVRVPKDVGPDVKSVTVTIRADQVAAELDKVREQIAQRARAKPAASPLGNQSYLSAPGNAVVDFFKK